MNPYEQWQADLERQREVLHVACAATAAAKAWQDEQREVLYSMLDKFYVRGPVGLECMCSGNYGRDMNEAGHYVGEMYEMSRTVTPFCPAHGTQRQAFLAQMTAYDTYYTNINR